MNRVPLEKALAYLEPLPWNVDRLVTPDQATAILGDEAEQLSELPIVKIGRSVRYRLSDLVEPDAPTSATPTQAPKELVYFIVWPALNVVKIGKAFDVARQLRQLKEGGCLPALQLLATVAGGGRELERTLHEEFSEWNVGEEWFSYSQPIADWVDQNADAELATASLAL